MRIYRRYREQNEESARDGDCSLQEDGRVKSEREQLLKNIKITSIPNNYS